MLDFRISRISHFFIVSSSLILFYFQSILKYHLCSSFEHKNRFATSRNGDENVLQIWLIKNGVGGKLDFEPWNPKGEMRFTYFRHE